MAYNYEFPYVDFGRYNNDWLIARLKELDAKVDKLEHDISGIVDEYVKEYLKPYQAQVDGLREELSNFETEILQQVQDLEQKVDADIAEIQRSVDQRLSEFESRIDSFAAELANSIEVMKAYTDRKVVENNNYILAHVSEFLGNIKVLNYFTAKWVTVQEMLDFLAQLHLMDALTYQQLADKDKTYDELAAYDLTYTEIMTRGHLVIN